MSSQPKRRQTDAQLLSLPHRSALFVEGSAAFLAIHRGLDQQVVDQVLDMPGLIGRQVAEADDELLHHPDCDRRHFLDVGRDFLRPFHQLVVRHHFVDPPDAQRLVGHELLDHCVGGTGGGCATR